MNTVSIYPNLLEMSLSRTSGSGSRETEFMELLASGPGVQHSAAESGAAAASYALAYGNPLGAVSGQASLLYNGWFASSAEHKNSSQLFGLQGTLCAYYTSYIQ